MVLAIPITINHSYLGPRRERCPKIAQQCDRLSNLVIKGVPRGRDSRSVVNGLNNRTSSFRGGDDVSRGLVVGDVLFDLRHELRRVALHHLPDARPELVEEVDPCIAANRRTKSLERRRWGSRP